MRSWILVSRSESEANGEIKSDTNNFLKVLIFQFLNKTILFSNSAN